jgi:signal transduction histidine kinase
MDNKSGGVEIVIEDNGPGIAKKDMPTIFDRFQRGDQTTKEGTGLGLAIVKSILDLHQFPYKLESEERKGTRFSFVLPQYPIEAFV